MVKIILDEDMRAVIAAQKLCFAATVTPEGLPNLSPKGTIRVWDEGHLFFCDITSPGTRRNLQTNPWIELNVVDTISRRGYRFLGEATLHTNDEIYQKATQKVSSDWSDASSVRAVVLVKIQRVLPLFSPAYEHVPDEWEMRSLWKERRTQLDTDFEQHIKHWGPWRSVKLE